MRNASSDTCAPTGKPPSVVRKGLRTTLRIDCPVITPIRSLRTASGSAFGQLSHVQLEVIPKGEIYPEDMIELVDRHALAPVYSYLTPEDQLNLTQQFPRAQDERGHGGRDQD